MAYSAKALLMLQAGNQTEGLNNLNKAIELEPENVEALTTRSKLLQNNSDYYNAINDYIKLTTITKKEGYFRIIVALCDEMKDFNKMKLATEKLLENNIIFGGEVNYYQAIALKTIGKVDEACEAMKQSADHGFHLARKKLDVFCKR